MVEMFNFTNGFKSMFCDISNKNSRYSFAAECVLEIPHDFI